MSVRFAIRELKMNKTQDLWAEITIDSDQDFDVQSPAGYFPANGPEYSVQIHAQTDQELRHNIIWELAQIAVHKPYVTEYDEFDFSSRAGAFKLVIYAAMHQISSGGEICFHRGGNCTLSIRLL